MGVFLAGCAVPRTGESSSARDEEQVSSTSVEINRTQEGIPQISARDWPSLGYGLGYAQAQDNLCTLAEAFVTYRGERAKHFGPDAKPDWHSPTGGTRNLDSDFFFRFVDTDAVVEQYEQAQSQEFKSLVAGFVQGYNHYLGQLQAGAFPAAHQACQGQPWVAPIVRQDIYRRLYAANLVGGYLNFIDAIVTASPPTPSTSSTQPTGAKTSAAPREQAGVAAATDEGQRTLALRQVIGGVPGAGSNGVALGTTATRGKGGLLLGNPHWFWTGPDRFYQARLTIPDVIDVSGVAFLGVPVIMMGFNRDVAWTHTVSSARRFGLFELTLQKGNPTSYLVDGKPEPMSPVAVSVQARRPDGSLETVTRTLYMTRYGPVVDLGRQAPGMGWSDHAAIALRDINTGNFRIFENFLAWDRAASLDDFIAAQKHYAAMPWVNTLAVGRNDPRAWYADIGAVPGVPDDLVQACTTQMGKAVNPLMPGVPFLDGSRSDCAWRTVPGAAQEGALPVEAMPSLARTDYVANMNNSYEYANPQAPLQGYAGVLGRSGVSPGLRARLGYSALNGMVERQGSGAAVREQDLRDLALDSRSESALLFKRQLLDAACGLPTLRVAMDPATGRTFDPPQAVPTGGACAVLARWNDSATADAAGANLWDAVWSRLARIPAQRLYVHPFAAGDPLGTPATLNVREPAVLQAFAAAILDFQRVGRALDEKRGQALYVVMGQDRIPLYGGCDEGGYFTSACTPWRKPREGDIAPRDLLGNTYLQVVDFGAGGGHAYTMLASGVSDDPASPYYAQATRRYAARKWTPWALYDSKELGARWRAYDAAHPGGIFRDASEYLGTTEAQLMTTELGAGTVLLKRSPADVAHLLRTMSTWGKVGSVMRNEYGISERAALMRQERVAPAGDGTAEIDLQGPLQARIFPANWKYVLAVVSHEGPLHQPRRNLQVYDEYGDSIAKFFVVDTEDGASFDKLTADLRADRQVIDPPKPRVFAPAGQERAVAASLRKAVRRADSAAAVENILEDLPPISHERLWRQWDPADVRELDAAAIRELGARVAASHASVLATVGNRGMVQQYTGRVDRAKPIGDGWYSFEADGVALHLHEPDIASARVVRLHALHEDVSVIEFIDTAGAVSMRFVGVPAGI
nr:penicillin acylase family protein [Bordetella sp. LUAb4]